jgi:hypothetical protein
MQGLLINPPVMTKKEEGTTLGPKIPSQKSIVVKSRF